MFPNKCLQNKKQTNVRVKDGGVNMYKYSKKRIRKHEIFLAVLGMIMFIISVQVVLLLPGEAEAVTYNEVMPKEKIITTVCVEKDSTLWDIASRYYTDDYTNINDMVQEIKRSNGMQTDTIHEGAYIIVPHYVTE